MGRGGLMAAERATFRIWRGDAQGGTFQDYPTKVSEGMVVLDAVHQIQAEQANDLAVRWNCKAGKCGSCSAEVNGNPRLMCMTRLNQLDLTEPVVVEPMRAFQPIRDLVTDVSWNFRAKKSIRRFKPRPPDAADGSWRMAQVDVERVQEFRKCIECFLCQDVCHVLREHRMFDEFVGPRHLVYAATLEMQTLSQEAVPRALAKAERYRLLNEPGEAESICLDALEADAGNQEALVTLLLALTDQFDDDATSRLSDAWKCAERMRSDYDRAYYTGIIWERRAKARLRRGVPDCGPRAYEWLREAMSWYERAEALRPAGNDDALLRWNTCARLIMRDGRLVPAVEERGEPL